MRPTHVGTRDEVRAKARIALDALGDECDSQTLEAGEAPAATSRVASDEPSAGLSGGGHNDSPEGGPQARDANRETKATLLVRLVIESGAELFHTPAGENYISVLVDGHREHRQLGSRASREYLTRVFYHRIGAAPSATALQDALATLGRMTRFDGSEHEVHVRVAGIRDRIYLDLGDSSHRVVEITSNGWRVVADTPVRFRRPKGVLPLPAPERGGSIADLRPFVNVETEDDFVLLVTWELAAIRPHGPYPILVFMVEQGAAKTTTTRALRRLCDSSEADVRRPPRNIEDLMIAATNGHVVAFDNLSRLPEDLSP